MIIRIATGLALFAMAAAGVRAETVYTEQQFASALDACIKAASMDEFETIEAVVERNRSACPLAGVIRRPLARRQGFGHIVTYDAEKRAFTWVVVPDPSFTTMAGGGASPYGKRYNPTQWGDLPSDVRSQLKSVGNTWFWLLPIIAKDDATSTYEASNAMGAKVTITKTTGKRYTLAVPTEWGPAGAKVVASVAVDPAEARDLVDHLALDIVFHSVKPCDVCFQGGTVERGTFGPPTFSSPFDVKLEHRYIYAEIDEIRFVDARNGRVVSSIKPTFE